MKICITGGAGSLGTAFAKYLAKDHEVTIIDNNEWAVAQFNVTGVDKILGGYLDVLRLASVRNKVPYPKCPFDFVIHCAAYKHVDLCEDNAEVTHWNNVHHYKHFAEGLTKQHQDIVNGKISYTPVPFLFISTDKAVEPISVYGKSKLAGEKVTSMYGGITARLGNIKSSNGSVIPIWEKAKSEGKPLPITDPEMTRYMIDVDDAVEKIWHLYQLAKPGQVIIPAMGEPIKLKDMVEELSPGYPTEVIGIRPGEKKHEKLKNDTEQTIYQDEYGEIVE